MPELLKSALPSLIALVGTLTVCYVGYRQWRKQQQSTRYGGFLAERQEAYKALWEKLEAAHLYVRSESLDLLRFRELVRAVNSHMIVKGLHLRDGEKERVNRYLSALETLGTCLQDASAGPAREEARDTLYATGELPKQVMISVRGLRDAYDRMETERGALITSFREVLGAPFFVI